MSLSYDATATRCTTHETATKQRKPLVGGDRYLDAADTEREHERVRGRLGVDSEGVSAHNGGRDGGQVVSDRYPQDTDCGPP